MLEGAHLFLGLVTGLALWGLSRDWRVVPVAITGALLPDIVDKPIGHILLQQSLDNGRLFFHGILLVCIVLLLGFFVMGVLSSPLVLPVAAAAGIFSHQLLDAMWHEPATWLYPFLGPFPRSFNSGFFGSYFWIEITNPSEWIFLISLIIAGSAWYLGRPGERAGSNGARTLRLCRAVLPYTLIGAGVWSAAAGVIGVYNALMTYSSLESNLILAIVFLTGGGVMMKTDAGSFAGKTTPPEMPADAEAGR
jgi:membrane-bound metal-dependent hydrolase YbcI (DUF457 family)